MWPRFDFMPSSFTGEADAVAAKRARLGAGAAITEADVLFFAQGSFVVLRRGARHASAQHNACQEKVRCSSVPHTNGSVLHNET